MVSTVLILSSFVAASRVGGGAQAMALARLGIEPILVPTVLFGRHPGWGAPGGGLVGAATMAAMLDAIEAQGLFARLDAVITGYFAADDQAAVAARALDRVRALNPAARLVVDPVMGDAGKGLYVSEAVAAAIASDLAPRADLVSPNAWELERLSGRTIADAAGAVVAARALGRPALVSSIPIGGDIGAIYADASEAWLASHARAADAPNGTGDLLTALFVAATIAGRPAPEALSLAVGGTADAVWASQGEAELALEALPSRLVPSPRVRIKPLAQPTAQAGL